MTRSLQAIRCLCGSEPVCPFHAPRITGESRIDRIYREARETVRRTKLRLGESYDYGGPQHHARRAFDLAVMAESTKQLEAAGVEVVVGLAGPDTCPPWSPWKGPPQPKQRQAGGPLHRAVRAAKKRIVGDGNWAESGEWATAKPRTPGTLLVRIPVKRDGVKRDQYEAAVDFAHEPWAADVRYLGIARKGVRNSLFLWERPDPEYAAESRRRHDDALASIRQYQTDGGE